MHIRTNQRALDALALAMNATGRALSKHALAVIALTVGARAIAARPSLVFDPDLRDEGDEAPAPTSAAPRAAPAAPAPKPRRELSDRVFASQHDLKRAGAEVRAAMDAGHNASSILSAAGAPLSGGSRTRVAALYRGDTSVRVTAKLVATILRGTHALGFGKGP